MTGKSKQFKIPMTMAGSDSSVTGVVCRLEKGGRRNVVRPVPWIEIPFLAHAPVIDGVLGAKEWQAAAKLKNFLAPISGEPVRPVTYCRLGLDDRNLYLAFDCEAPTAVKPRAKGKISEVAVAVDDRIECFICPDNAQPCYYMFSVNSGGGCRAKKVAMDALGTPGAHAETWRPPWEAKVGRNQNGWTVEMAIPWSTLELEPKGFRGIRLNCCRGLAAANQPRRQINSSWVFLPALNFHWPAKFGIGLCNFDRCVKAPLALTDLQLNALGLLDAKRVSPVFPVPNKFAALCVAALPRHPLLPNLEAIRLVAELIPVGANGKKGLPAVVGTFTLAPYQPARLVVEGLAQGDYLLSLHFLADGMTHACAFPVMGQTLKDIETHLQNIPAVAEQSPFRAAAYLGAAAGVDRIRRQVTMECPADEVLLSIREAKIRLDILKPDRADVGDDGLLALLNLARDPEAQVVVEYLHRRRQAAVTFFCGAIPLVSVDVTEYDTPAEAAGRLPLLLDRDRRSPMLDSGIEITKIAGYPARLSTKIYDEWSHRPMTSPFNAASQVLLAAIERQTGLALDVKYLDCAKVDAVAILPGCPPAVRAAVAAWAQKKRTPILSLADALRQEHIMVAGDPRSAGDQFSLFKLSPIYPMSEAVNGTVSAAVVCGRRLCAVWHAPRAVAEQALRLVAAGKPVQPPDVDALRMDIVKHGAPKTAFRVKPRGWRPYCGDVHMHTSYSHGEEQASPVGLALESLYCFMDFIAITDHDQIDGAQLAQRLLQAHQVAYTLMVGAEISSRSAHVNVYPLKELIPNTLSPAEVARAAHRQGAVIQWNHPDSELAQMPAFNGDGFDAWEHYPRQYYDEWQKAGTLPALMGGSDTHDGTFGFFAFGYFERTLVLAPSAREADVIEAIRRKHVVLVTPAGGGFFYGPDSLVAAAWSALADGRGLKAAKAGHLRAVLRRADLLGLILDNSPRQGKYFPETRLNGRI